MRKLHFYLLVAAGVLALASCEKEDKRAIVETPAPAGPTLTIRADYPEITDEDGTKLSLDPSSSYKMTWDGGEVMTVFAGKMVRNTADDADSLIRTKFTLTGGTGADIGVFTGTPDFGDTGLTVADIKAVAVGPAMSASQESYFRLVNLKNDIWMMYPGSIWFTGTGVLDGRYMMPHAIVSPADFIQDGDNYTLGNVQLYPATAMLMLNIYDSSGAFSSAKVTKVQFVSNYYYSNAGAVNLSTGDVQSVKGEVDEFKGLTENSNHTTTLATPELIPSTKADGIKVFMTVRPAKRTNATKDDTFLNRYVRITLDNGVVLTKYLDPDNNSAKGITRSYSVGNLYTANIDFSMTKSTQVVYQAEYSVDGGSTWSPMLPTSTFSSLKVRTDPSSSLSADALTAIKTAIDTYGAEAGVDLDLSESKYSYETFPNTFKGTTAGSSSVNNGITVTTPGTNIKSLKFPSNVTTLAANALQGCTSLRSVDLTGVKTINSYSLANTGLKTLVVPETVTSAGTMAFGFNWDLEEVWYYPTTQISTTNSYLFGCRNNKATAANCPAWYKPYDATTNTGGFKTTLTFHFGPGAMVTKYMFDSNTRLAKVIFEGNPGNAGADAWFIRCRGLDIIDCSKMTEEMSFTTSNASSYQIGLYASNRKIYVPAGTADRAWGLFTTMKTWTSSNANNYNYTMIEGSPE